MSQFHSNLLNSTFSTSLSDFDFDSRPQMCKKNSFVQCLSQNSSWILMEFVIFFQTCESDVFHTHCVLSYQCSKEKPQLG